MNVRFYIVILFILCTLPAMHFIYGNGNASNSRDKRTAAWFNQLSEDTLEYNYAVSRQLAREALNHAQKNNKINELARAYKNIAESYYKAEVFDTSTRFYHKSNELYQQLDNHQQIGYTYLSIGLNHYYQANYKESMLAYNKAQSVYEKTGNNEKLALIYQNIGLVYNELEDHQKALVYLNQSQEIFIDLDARYNMANNYHNIGAVYSKMEEYDKATHYYEKSYNIFHEINNIHGIGSTLNNMGMVLAAGKNHEQAIKKYHESLVYFRQEKNRYGELSVYHNLGIALMEINRIDDARLYLEKSMELANKHGYIQNYMEGHKSLSHLYENEGSYKEALSHYKKYYAIKDSVNNKETRAIIAEIESDYQHKLDSKELEKHRLLLQRSQIQKTGLLVVMLLFLVFSVFLYKINLRRKKVQHQLKSHKKSLQRLVEEQTEQLKVEISERKLAEESDQLKSAFLANMSHELRTPMNAIIAFSSFLHNPDLTDEKRKEYIQHINSSGKSLLQIIDDIVDSAKIEARQLKINKIRGDLTRLFREEYELFLHSLKAENKEEINLILDIPYNNPVMIEMDPVRLKQVVSNLLENAKKYTQCGSIRFGYVIKHDHIRFFVEDTGIGIPENKQQYIFERFSRIDYKDDKRLRGTGLGLAICKNLVELMGGTISVRSEPDVGSIFIFTLPCGNVEILKENISMDEDNHIPPEPDSFNWQDKTVLIAEDEDLNYKVLQAALTRTRATIIRALDGEEAINICRQQKIDIILMDIQMPKIDGLEATQKIKEMLPALPIIAQTSFALNGERERCIKAGCDDYLSKPIDLQKLLRITSHFLA
ncbi:MAG: tetratricopeptide repeat protein [Bacteroidetes bacterium]|jgi:signal transduction histidine kinase|nr:tetratricopeptide repeat protein [Bacteroidota bacterium]